MKEIKEYSVEIAMYLALVIPVLILGLAACGVLGVLINKLL